MKPLHCTFEDNLNFKHVTLYVIAMMEFNLDGYFNLYDLQVVSKGELKSASERLKLAFQNHHWNFLYDYCLGYAQAMAEYHRELRREGCLPSYGWMTGEI